MVHMFGNIRISVIFFGYICRGISNSSAIVAFCLRLSTFEWITVVENLFEEGMVICDRSDLLWRKNIYLFYFQKFSVSQDIRKIWCAVGFLQLLLAAKERNAL